LARKRYLVWFNKNGKGHSVRGINAESKEAAHAEAQRRIDEGGIIGILERGEPGPDGLGDYLFGRPGIGLTVCYVLESGEADELGDRDIVNELYKKGLGPPPATDPSIPF
jgi:hypothetical protein